MTIRLKGLLIILFGLGLFAAFEYMGSVFAAPPPVPSSRGTFSDFVSTRNLSLVIPGVCIIAGVLQIITGIEITDLMQHWSELPERKQKKYASLIIGLLVLILGGIAFWSMWRQRLS